MRYFYQVVRLVLDMTVFNEPLASHPDTWLQVAGGISLATCNAWASLCELGPPLTLQSFFTVQLRAMSPLLFYNESRQCLGAVHSIFLVYFWVLASISVAFISKSLYIFSAG